LAFIGVEVAAIPGEEISEAVAPPTIALEKARLFMSTISPPYPTEILRSCAPSSTLLDAKRIIAAIVVPNGG
jgi:hypothetical protein